MLFESMDYHMRKEAEVRVPLKAIAAATVECERRYGSFLSKDPELRFGFLSDDIKKVADSYASQFGADPATVLEGVIANLKEADYGFPVQDSNPKSVDVETGIGGAEGDKYKYVDVEQTHDLIGVPDESMPRGGRDPKPYNDINKQGPAEAPPYADDTTTAPPHGTMVDMPTATGAQSLVSSTKQAFGEPEVPSPNPLMNSQLDQHPEDVAHQAQDQINPKSVIEYLISKGYSPEEAADVVNNAPMQKTLPPRGDMMGVQDGLVPQGRMASPQSSIEKEVTMALNEDEPADDDMVGGIDLDGGKPPVDRLRAYKRR